MPWFIIFSLGFLSGLWLAVIILRLQARSRNRKSEVEKTNAFHKTQSSGTQHILLQKKCLSQSKSLSKENVLGSSSGIWSRSPVIGPIGIGGSQTLFYNYWPPLVWPSSDFGKYYIDPENPSA